MHPLTRVVHPAILLLLAHVALAQPASRPSLAGHLGITEDDLREADRGGVAARVLDTPFRKEVAAVAVVRVRATRAAFLAVASDPEALLRTNEHVAAWGRLSASPAATELAGVSVDPWTLRTLEECRPGRCGLKLDAGAVERLRREVPWRSPAAADRASRVLRESLAERAAAYWLEGVESLLPLVDRNVPLDVAARTRDLLERPPRLAELDDAVAHHLAAFPADRAGTMRDQLLWVREGFWRRQVLSLVHLSAHAPVERPGQASVVLRQIHASHYFEAALAATVFAGVEERAYLVRFDRFETDHRQGGFNVLERALIRRGARKRLETQMSALRAAVEAREHEMSVSARSGRP